MNNEMIISSNVTEVAVDWLEQLRVEYRPQAWPLSAQERVAFAPFFKSALLEDIRVLVLDNLCVISDAKIRKYFPADGAPIDLKAITGLTLIDTICVGKNRLQGPAHLQAVLFQETVHAAQFRALGVKQFLALYIEDWARAGRSHDNIVLERQALALRQRFETYPKQVFSVEQELAHVD